MSSQLPAGWRRAPISEVAEVITSPVDKKTVSGEIPVLLCNYTDVYHNAIISKDMPFMRATATPSEVDKFSLKLGDVVVTKDSETADDIGVPAYVKSSKSHLLCGYHLAILRPQPNVDGRFLTFALGHQRVSYDFYRYANGVTRFGLTLEAYCKVKLPLPPLPEQKAIAGILQKWDEAIDKTQALISAKQKQFEWLLKRLISDQQGSLGWRDVALGDVITTITPPVKIPKEQFGEIGEFPIVDQSQMEIAGWTNDKGSLVICSKPVVVFGDHTCVVKYVDRPFAQGADGIKILLTDEIVLPKFLYFVLGAYPLSSEGYKRHFSNLKKSFIPVPPLPEQKRIAHTLNTAQREIGLLKQLADRYRTQERGLMQKLLTGEWRVTG